MPVFVCDKCHVIDNTACGGNYWTRLVEDTKKQGSGMILCCECHTGKWHDQFPRVVFDPIVHGQQDFIYIPKSLRPTK